MGRTETIRLWVREIRSLPKKGRLRNLLRRLLHEHDPPRRLAAAIAIGVFIGTLPFFGLHMWIGLVVALIARLNKLAVFLGTQISLPWIAPILIFTSIQIGHLVLYHSLLEIDLSSFDLADLSTLFVPWLIGSLALGTVLSLLSYGLALPSVLWLSRLRKRGSKTSSNTKDMFM